MLDALCLGYWAFHPVLTNLEHVCSQTAHLLQTVNLFIHTTQSCGDWVGLSEVAAEG